MRRKDKEIHDIALIEKILTSNKVCHVALSQNNKPYIVPMNYGYSDNTMYLHSALTGTKMDILKNNNRVCIEISDSISTATSDNACSYGTRYRSVICNGTIHIVEDQTEKIRGLDLLMQQVTGKQDWNIPQKGIENVAVLKVSIDHMTGKLSGLYNNERYN